MTAVQPARAARKRAGASARPSSRDEIRDAFTRRVAESGYDGTNFGAIAEELGISKGTIVHHFGTKELLFADAHERYMENRLAEAKDIVARLDSPVTRLAGLVWAFAMYQTYGRTETVAFQREIIRFNDAPSMQRSRELRDEYLDLLKNVLVEGIDAGFFHDGNVSIWALQIFGGTQWMWTWFNPSGSVSNDDVAQSYVTLILRGLLLDAGVVDALIAPAGTVRIAVYEVLDAAAQAL
ncbi:TetR/AcrR family transcriptional regulator [Gordonia sp. TBRC 11910]|uniref:TetR/AcrR family transcriptional regulator n=1 Tax=Gordonia asplenii TaxID=2725283 RepID=A0A848KWG6_9ACTN|nr:TetR/AcrR family transcriptional regulator [Gordonia asplenii]NMO02639.1 TetR/AcrR family transcriptional regulator [Gordonia asplenii]